MCLTIVSKSGLKPKIAKKDIVCYKSVIRYNPINNTVDSAYKGYTYKLNSKNKIIKKLFMELSIVIRGYTRYSELRIGYHSFNNLKEAKREANYWNEYVVKCIIPKGSIYYNGKFMEGLNDPNCRVSNNIILTEVITK